MRPETTEEPASPAEPLPAALKLVVAGHQYTVDEEGATWLAESLRHRFAESVYGRADNAGLDVADRLEAVLVGGSSEPVELSDEEQDAVHELVRGPLVRRHEQLSTFRAGLRRHLGHPER